MLIPYEYCTLVRLTNYSTGRSWIINLLPAFPVITMIILYLYFNRISYHFLE